MFSHGSGLSGAEIALLNHAKILINQGHTVTLATPNQGPLNQRALSMGIKSITHPFTWITHQPLDCFFRLNASQSMSSLQEKFNKLSPKPTLIFTNTICIVDGAIFAAANNIPHIWSIHETIPNHKSDSDLSPFSPDTLKRWIQDLSDQIIFCSRGALNSFDKNIAPQKSVTIPPYIHKNHSVNRFTEKDPFRLYFIGSLTERKNPIFAIDILFILRSMGININLYFIGPKTSYASNLLRAISKRKLKKYVFFTGQVNDPYTYIHGKAINLICSDSEPFGLTIPESLSRGIPTVSTATEGPSDLLSAEYLYSINDHGECCRKIIQLINHYEEEAVKATKAYLALSEQFKNESISSKLNHTIQLAKNNYSIKKIPKNLIDEKLISSAKLMNEPMEKIGENFFRNHPQFLLNFNEALTNEKSRMGFNVNQDCQKYGVIKHCATKEMDALYRDGSSFSIELLAHHDSPVRQKIFAYISILLQEKFPNKTIKILSIGDGIGLDSIRLALQGYRIDYLDIDESITAKFAFSNVTHFQKEIFKSGGDIKFIKQFSDQDQYDAIICLEVLEHIKKPEGLVSQISKSLREDSLLFISECFEGIEPSWPTHLIENEKLTGLLPELCRVNGLELYSYNKTPFGKPYVFTRCKTLTISNHWLKDIKLLKRYTGHGQSIKLKNFNRFKLLANKIRLYFGMI